MKVIINIALLLSIASGARTQEGSFSASVDRDHVAMGDQFEITFTLNGSTTGKNFRPPTFDDFLVLSGPNQSTNMQFINGTSSASLSYGYVLQPRGEGKFIIGAASIEVGGKQLRTQLMTVEVTKGSPPKQQAKQTKESNTSQQIGDNVFLKVTVDKARVYQGEQITTTYKLYTRVSIVNYGVTKAPSLTGFWSEDLELPKQIQLSNEVLNGKQYRVGILKKVALFPQRSGTLEIDPMEVECVVQMQIRRRSNDIFDQFFNDPFFGNVTNVNHKIRSEPLKISVLPLPVANVPAGFSGAVGKFSMEAWLDKHQTKTNEAVTLKIKISGRGNLKLLELPPINIPPDLERYDPKISDNITKQGNQIAGSRTFEYLLIPRHAGEQRISSFPFAFFDVEKRTFVSSASPEFILNVEKGSELAPMSASGMSKEDIKLLGEDIRFIKSGETTFHRKGESFISSPSFYALSISPVLAFFGFVFYVRRRETLAGDVIAFRNRKARKLAQERLRGAKKFLQAKKRGEFYTEISRALWGYVADKLGLPHSELSIDTIRSALLERGVSAETVVKFASTMEQCDFARFAPSADSLQMDWLYREAFSIISLIEDQVRR